MQFLGRATFPLPGMRIGWTWNSGPVFWGQWLAVFKEGHAEEIRCLAGTAEAEFFVEAHGALERRRGVQSDASAILAAEFGFGMSQQLGGDSHALAAWEDGHASEVAFVLADDLASNGADDLAGSSFGNENSHSAKTVLQGLAYEHGVEVGGGRVGIAIRCEGCSQASEDFGSVIVSGTADRDCGG
jgi:hypothetical protein